MSEKLKDKLDLFFTDIAYILFSNDNNKLEKALELEELVDKAKQYYSTSKDDFIKEVVEKFNITREEAEILYRMVKYSIKAEEVEKQLLEKYGDWVVIRHLSLTPMECEIYREVFVVESNDGKKEVFEIIAYTDGNVIVSPVW